MTTVAKPPARRHSAIPAEGMFRAFADRSISCNRAAGFCSTGSTRFVPRRALFF